MELLWFLHGYERILLHTVIYQLLLISVIAATKTVT